MIAPVAGSTTAVGEGVGEDVAVEELVEELVEEVVDEVVDEELPAPAELLSPLEGASPPDESESSLLSVCS